MKLYAYLENPGVFAGFAAFAKKMQKKKPNSGARGGARTRFSFFFVFEPRILKARYALSTHFNVHCVIFQNIMQKKNWQIKGLPPPFSPYTAAGDTANRRREHPTKLPTEKRAKIHNQQKEGVT